MAIAEELVRLSDDKEKGEINGWRVVPSSSSSLRPRQRLVDKNGRTLLAMIELPQRLHIDIRNWFHLLIECTWTSVTALFFAGYIVTWIFFAFLYYIVVLYKHDEKCIENVQTFTAAFLFSIETQHTIGYGIRHMNEICPVAYIILVLQLIIGVLIQTMLGGVIIAKVLRPKKRRQEMRFSRFAVIGPVDNDDPRPALMIRVADIQEKLFLAESHVRLYMASTRVTENGERELLGMRDINVGYDSGWDRVLLLWPVVVRHVIDENSPLYGITKDNLLKQEFELIMTVEGIVEATGMTFQARTSFLPEEIVWGEKFKPMVVMGSKKQKYEIRYHLFDQTEKCEGWDCVDTTTKVDEEDEVEYKYASGFR